MSSRQYALATLILFPHERQAEVSVMVCCQTELGLFALSCCLAPRRNSEVSRTDVSLAARARNQLHAALVLSACLRLGQGQRCRHHAQYIRIRLYEPRDTFPAGMLSNTVPLPQHRRCETGTGSGDRRVLAESQHFCVLCWPCPRCVRERNCENRHCS